MPLIDLSDGPTPLDEVCLACGRPLRDDQSELCARCAAIALDLSDDEDDAYG